MYISVNCNKLRIKSAFLQKAIKNCVNVNSTWFTLTQFPYTVNLKYYGQDSETRKKSKTYDATYKYIITDEESKKLNEVYYTTNAYYDPAEGPTPMLMQFIVPNLYGTEYEWAQSI